MDDTTYYYPFAMQASMVEQMCRDIMDFSHGKQKVKSSGIMEFGVSRDQYEPNIFYTWERYDSNGALGRHNTCPEFQAFMENVRPPSDQHEYLRCAIPAVTAVGAWDAVASAHSPSSSEMHMPIKGAAISPEHQLSCVMPCPDCLWYHHLVPALSSMMPHDGLAPAGPCGSISSGRPLYLHA